MNAWFGQHWGAPVCDTTPHIETPVGGTCIWCEEPIAEGDNGYRLPNMGAPDEPVVVYFHQECLLRTLIGSVSHQLRLCKCFGGDVQLDEDDATISKREAARAAFDLAMDRAPENGKRSSD